MKLGTATLDITPPAGVELSGYLARVQPSLGVHDPLHVRALVLAGESARLLWLHCDLVGFAHSWVQELKSELAERMGVRRSEIVVSATHTHSGPATVELIRCGTPDPAYLRWLRTRLADAARQAVERTEPVELLHAETTCSLGVERRGRSDRHTDPRLGLLVFRRPDRTFTAVLANYGLHNVAMSEQNRLVSADIAGRAAETLAGRLPGQPAVLMTNGAAGNINPPAVRNDFAWVEQWGDRLATAAEMAFQGRRVRRLSDQLRVASEFVTLPVVALDPTSLEVRVQHLRKPFVGRSGYVPERFLEGIEIWRERMAARIAAGRAAEGLSVEVQCVQLGDVVFTCIGAEVFSRLPDALRSAAGRPVYVVSYANGVAGYLAPESAYDEGCYEVDQAFVWYGTPPIARGAFELVRDRAAALMAG